MTGGRSGHADVWRIAAPMMLSNVTVPLLGIVDTAVVGHLDSPVYLAAVAVGATIFGFLFTGFNFLRMGTTGIAAQAFGAGDRAAIAALRLQSLTVAVALGVVLIGLNVPVLSLSLALIAPDPPVAAEAAAYYGVRIWAAPAVLANFVLVGWFIGLSNARAPLALMVLINVVNIVLDLVFVPVLGFGVRGVAAASVAAEYTGAIVGIWLSARHLGGVGAPWSALGDSAALWRLAAVNGHLLVRTLALMFAFAFMTAQAARLGPLILAANAVLMNLQYLLSYALDGLANAAEALVGRAAGQGDRKALWRAIALSRFWSVVFALAFAAGFWLFGTDLIAVMTDLESVRETAAAYLPWLIASPLVSLWPFLYDGVYVGATRAREMRDTMLAATFGVFVPAWYLLADFGNHGLWAAFLLFMAARGGFMHWLLYRLDRRGGLVRAEALGGDGRAG